MTRINIEKVDSKLKLPGRKLKKLVTFIIEREGLDFDEINIIFVDDARIREINREFLNHDYPTDVIAFDLRDDYGKVAEIYISFETGMRQSVEYGVSFENEIARLVSHGLLHLAGYSDETEEGRDEMRRLEDGYISHFL